MQRITITDDDELALTVELSAAAIAEAGGTSTVTVKTDDVTFADDQTITLVLGGTATETDDYTVTKELTLDAGESSVTTTVTAVQDTYDDDGETIEIKARHGAGTESGVQRITITDDDELALTVELSAAVIAEAGGTSTVTVKTDDVTFADDQTITLVLGGTATETDDYTVTKELTLDAGESSVTTTVTAVQDTYDDDGETIEIKARHGAGTESGVQRITITDDDELALTVELSAAAIAEAGGTSTVTVKTDDVTFADDQTITLVLGGTATETDDYTVTKELTLDAGESSVTTTVTAVQDTYDDDGETIEIKARHGAGTESGVQRITITDDDELALTVELSAAAIAEAGGTSTVTVKTDDVTFADDQTITLVLGGTATETDDYTVTKELTLDAGESSVTTTVTAVQDTYDDDGETIEIKARHGVGTESAVQRITITDDDELALTVELSAAAIAEAGGTSTVTVKTDDVTFADDQTITLVLGGTATETDDYTVTKELTLDAGESSVTTTVTAVQDTYDDDGETIEIKARHGVGTESGVQRITITDDDELALTVELSAAAIAEAGGTSTVTVKTDDVTFADDQTITLVLGGTATETDDYTVTKELTLDAGESSVTTTVTAVQDTYDDDGETIEIKARHGAGTESAVQRITITDDDELALTVELSAAVIAEAGGTSTVTVKTDDVTFADDQTITLVLGGTATETDDYTVTKELTLDAGESSVTTTVTAVQDTYDDDGETIEIKARHGAGTESGVQRITITDDDELALTVELSAAVIAEAGGTSTVTVKTDDVTFADDQTITLVLGGTATETDDYTVTKELTLDAGESSVTTTVTAVQDTYDDDGETIEIKARHGAGTESGVQRITITDDDELALTVELSAAVIAEAGGTSTVTVKTDDVTFADDQTITLVLGAVTVDRALPGIQRQLLRHRVVVALGRRAAQHQRDRLVVGKRHVVGLHRHRRRPTSLRDRRSAQLHRQRQLIVVGDRDPLHPALGAGAVPRLDLDRLPVVVVRVLHRGHRRGHRALPGIQRQLLRHRVVVGLGRRAAQHQRDRLVVGKRHVVGLHRHRRRPTSLRDRRSAQLHRQRQLIVVGDRDPLHPALGAHAVPRLDLDRLPVVVVRVLHRRHRRGHRALPGIQRQLLRHRVVVALGRRATQHQRDRLVVGKRHVVGLHRHRRRPTSLRDHRSAQLHRQRQLIVVGDRDPLPTHLKVVMGTNDQDRLVFFVEGVVRGRHRGRHRGLAGTERQRLR